MKGKEELLREKIARKLQKGKEPEQMAEELEVSLEKIQQIIKKLSQSFCKDIPYIWL